MTITIGVIGLNWRISRKFVFKLTTTLTVTACTVLSLNISVLAASHDVQQQINHRTKQEVLDKFEQYRPQSFLPTELFRVNPNYTAPHRTGQLNDSVLLDALNATNFARYLAGLPDDVTLDYTLAEQQQAGAVLMSELGTITHYPQKPDGMAEDFFQLGSRAASTSNLSAGRNSLYNTVFYGYMADNSYSNLDTVGHRRWIINPQMKKTMFGLAYNPSSFYGYYSTMYAFNTERSMDEVSYQYIAWPSAGLFPTEILSAQDPWSISLNPSLYDVSRLNEAYVTISRDSDNKQWRLDENNKDKDGNFFKLELSGYGIANAIIFRPGDIGQYAADDVYHVTLHNIYTVDGQRSSISYVTSMFDLQAKFKNNTTRFAVVGQKLRFPINGTAMRYTSSDPSIASVDTRGVVTAHKPGYVDITVDNYFATSHSTFTLYISKLGQAKINDWAKSSILQANEVGILNNNPYSEDLTVPVTREQFVNYVVAMLEALSINIETSRHYGKTSPFSDIDSYQNDILWAYENRIISGTGNGKFSPYDTITREQAATLLLNVYNYLQGKEKPKTIASFTDEDNISVWAKYSVKRAAELSIMGPTSGNRFDPKGKYSHEQTIVTMLRLYQKLAK